VQENFRRLNVAASTAMVSAFGQTCTVFVHCLLDFQALPGADFPQIKTICLTGKLFRWLLCRWFSWGETNMHPGSEDPRIEAMFRQDRAWSLVAIIALWLTLVFVFVQIVPETGSSGVMISLFVAGGLVLLFNTASIAALLRHYTEDKQHLYGLDLHYLDEIKKMKR